MPARAVLCNRFLPTGKTCTQPALRGEPFCRFHNAARSRALAEHDERMFDLSDELDAMTIPQLLETVHHKLGKITSVVRAFGEARLAVIVAIQRLGQLTAEGFAITKNPRPRPGVAPTPMQSMTHSQPQQNQWPALNPKQFMDLAASLIESATSPQTPGDENSENRAESMIYTRHAERGGGGG
jgi:hypothetical protein